MENQSETSVKEEYLDDDDTNMEIIKEEPHPFEYFVIEEKVLPDDQDEHSIEDNSTQGESEDAPSTSGTSNKIYAGEKVKPDDNQLSSGRRNASSKPKKKKIKPKVVSDWSDDDIYKLIACVKKRPALWNSRHGQYRNKQQRKKLWNEMSENDFYMKFGGAELLAKWSNARIQFRSHSVRKNKLGPTAPPRVSWKFFGAMQFIENAECEQNTSRDSNLGTEESDISHQGDKQIPKRLRSPQDSNLITNPTVDISRKRRFSVSTVESTSSTNSHSTPNTGGAEGMKTEVELINQSKQPSSNHSDEFEAFGKFLASELRSLDNLAMARRIKHKLNRYFLDVVEDENVKTEN